MFAASKTAAAAAGTPPPSTDPQFNYVTMLLHGDGTNGAQNNTFVDSSTNNFTITRNGTPTQGSFSPYGDLWSNQFKGTTDYLTVGGGMPSGQGTEFTLEFWAFVPTAGVNVFTEGSGSGTLDFYVESNGTVKLDNTGVANILATASGAFQFGTWVHVALTRTTGNLYTLYINGVSVASGTNSTSYAANTTIGWHRNTASAYFKGYLSNWRVTNTRVYTSAFTPSTTPLTAVSGTSLLTCQSNRFVDNSSNNFAITVTGTPSVQRFSPFDPAAEYSTSVIGGSGLFSGSVQNLSVPNNAALSLDTGDFTIEAWVYLNATTDQTVVASLTNSSRGYGLQLNSTSMTFLIFNGSSISGRIDFSGAIARSTWHHLAVSRSGTTTRLFLNGTLVQTATLADQNAATANAVFVAGQNFSGFPNYLNGYIANLRIVKGTAVYTASFTPPTAPLTAITNTSLLLNTVNAGIFDNAMMNDLVTVGNAQVSTAVKKYGTGSIAFDGTGDWLTFVDTPNMQLGTGDFTIEGWMYLPLLGTARGLVSKGTSTTGWSVGVNLLNQLTFSYTSSTLTGSTALTMGTWVHFAIVRSGSATGNVKIYFNGVADATSAGAITDNFNQTNSGYIGADRVGTSPMNGYIDDLRITKGIARYTANFTPPTAALPNN